jgi:Carbohydrate esterase, sialic acid-specific acetylesterase
MAEPQSVRLVSFAWGEEYVEDLLEYALPAVLAPGNLPALCGQFDCSVSIVTETRFFPYIRSHPTIRALQTICSWRLFSLDDLLAEPWQYGMTLTYAIMRGFEDLGDATTEVYLLFLNADFVLADGSYAQLIALIRSGERIHLAPSYCVRGEQTKVELERRKMPNGIISLPPRELAKIILDNRHDTIIAKTVNRSLFEFEFSDQFYWEVNDQTLIGVQMPPALVGMRPERYIRHVESFWDWGTVYDFCPSQQVKVIGDSDNFLMLELRAESRFRDLIRLGNTTPKQIARRMRGYATNYQRDGSRFLLTLHSGQLPPEVTVAAASLRSHVDQVLAKLPTTLPSHAAHVQWQYHRRRYRERFKPKSVGAVGGAIATESARRFHVRAYRRSKRIARRGYGLMIRIARSSHRLFNNLAHPYDSKRFPLGMIITEVTKRTPAYSFAICEQNSRLLRVLDKFPGNQIHLTGNSMLSGALDKMPRLTPKFDLCVIELSNSTEGRLAEIFRSAASRMHANGRVLLLWNKRSTAVKRDKATEEMVICLLENRLEGDVSFLAHWISASAFFTNIGWPRWQKHTIRRKKGASACLVDIDFVRHPSRNKPVVRQLAPPLASKERPASTTLNSVDTVQARNNFGGRSEPGAANFELEDIQRRLETAAITLGETCGGVDNSNHYLGLATHYTLMAELISRHWCKPEQSLSETWPADDHTLDYAVSRGVYVPGNEVEINQHRAFVPWRHLFDDHNCGVFLILGQSNAANHGAGKHTAQQRSYCLDFLRMRCYIADDPLPGASGNEGSVWSQLGDMIIEGKMFQNVLFVPLAFGGSFISDWVAGGSMYGRTSLALSRIRKALNTRFLPFSGILWQQGEAEANHTNMSDLAYKMYFHDVVGDLRAHGVFAPIFVARSTICESGDHPYRNHAAIRRAQGELADPYHGIFPGPDTDQIGAEGRRDGCHFSDIGLHRCAALWFEVLSTHKRLLQKL